MIYIRKIGLGYEFPYDKGYIPTDILRCGICDIRLDNNYSLLINDLQKSDLLDEDFVPLCCCCYHVLQPETKIEKRYKCGKLDLRLMTDSMTLRYDWDFLNKLKRFGNEMQKEFYSKITGEKL